MLDDRRSIDPAGSVVAPEGLRDLRTFLIDKSSTIRAVPKIVDPAIKALRFELSFPLLVARSATDLISSFEQSLTSSFLDFVYRNSSRIENPTDLTARIRVEEGLENFSRSRALNQKEVKDLALLISDMASMIDVYIYFLENLDPYRKPLFRLFRTAGAERSYCVPIKDGDAYNRTFAEMESTATQITGKNKKEAKDDFSQLSNKLRRFVFQVMGYDPQKRIPFDFG